MSDEMTFAERLMSNEWIGVADLENDEKRIVDFMVECDLIEMHAMKWLPDVNRYVPIQDMSTIPEDAKDVDVFFRYRAPNPRGVLLAFSKWLRSSPRPIHFSMTQGDDSHATAFADANAYAPLKEDWFDGILAPRHL